ncbi:MAG TPA: hypothetical protein VGG44_01800 [Tepidisphaeraceae bacterium]
MSGCTPKYPDNLYYHVIEFDPNGKIVDLYKNERPKNVPPPDQFNDILNNMQTSLAGKSNPKVILYVHGGLNTPSEAIDVAQQHLGDITKEDPSCYPIFVIWDSGLLDTYREHLFDVRQGRNNSETRAWGWVDWPVYLVSDFLVAIARAPTVWFQQGTTDSDAFVAGVDSIFSHDRTQDALEKSKTGAGPATRPDDSGQRADLWLERKDEVNAAAFYLVLNRLYYEDSRHAATRPTTQISISIGVDHAEPADWVGKGVIYFVFLPFKLIFAPIIDGLGTPAWREMGRRAQAIVDGSSDFAVSANTKSKDIDAYVDRGTDGGLDLFVSELADRARPAKLGAPPKWQITLIAHSAGTVVLNEVLRHQIQRELKAGTPSLPVQNIVYMAAACSIRDFTESVIPFMQLRKHENVKFYNLTLHPSAEMLEAEAWELAPRGSLLCWIDDFLTSPQNPLDRTLGRWDNIVQTPYVFPESLRGRVSIKAFALERPNAPTTQPILEPQEHGDFTESPFWDPNFWKPAAALNPKGSRISVAEQEKERVKETAPKPVNAPGN